MRVWVYLFVAPNRGSTDLDFNSIIERAQNKLGCHILWGFLSLVSYLWARLESTRVQHLTASQPMGRLLLSTFARTKHPSLFWHNVSGKEEEEKVFMTLIWGRTTEKLSKFSWQLGGKFFAVHFADNFWNFGQTLLNFNWYLSAGYLQQLMVL